MNQGNQINQKNQTNQIDGIDRARQVRVETQLQARRTQARPAGSFPIT